MKQIQSVLPKFIGIISVLFLSGCASYHLREGNRLYNSMAYNSAVPEYEKALARKDYAEAKIKLADCYRMMNNTVKAEEALAKVVTLPEADPKYKLYYAQALMQDGKCEEAKKYYDDYLTKMPADSAARLLRSSCDSTAALMVDSAKYTVDALNINTGETNFAPVYYADGIVFVSDRTSPKHGRIYEWTGRPYLDLYASKKDSGGKWQTPVILPGTANGIYHDGPATFSADG